MVKIIRKFECLHLGKRLNFLTISPISTSDLLRIVYHIIYQSVNTKITLKLRVILVFYGYFLLTTIYLLLTSFWVPPS